MSNGTEDEHRKRIMDAARDMFSVDLPLLGKRQLIADSYLEKHAEALASQTTSWWEKIQAFVGSMFDSIYKYVAPESYAKSQEEAQAKAAVAAREQERTTQLTKKITDDIKRDTGNAVTSEIAAVITKMVSTGRIKQDNIDELVTATDGVTWNEVLPQLAAATSLKAEAVANGGHKIQLDLPGGKQQIFNTRSGAAS